MKECECERGESERARGGLGSLFKKAGKVACTRPWAAKINVHWLERAVHGTAGRGGATLFGLGSIDPDDFGPNPCIYSPV
jgi:hypothetical protein